MKSFLKNYIEENHVSKEAIIRILEEDYKISKDKAREIVEESSGNHSKKAIPQ